MTADTSLEPHSPRDRAGHRLASLDLLRGLTVFGMIMVNGIAGVERVDSPVFPPLQHSTWAGFTIADAVFPAFIFMVGVSIAISVRGQPQRIDTVQVLTRALRLVLLGLILSNLFFLANVVKFGPPRLPGVLQRIGIVYAGAALLYARVGWRGRAGIAAAILLLYWPLCLIPSPDGLPTDIWAQGHNFVSWADRAVFGSWRFVHGADGYDPEGLLATLPTLAQALIGTLVGDYLLRARPRGEAAGRMALAALAMLIGGLLWGLVFPIAKNFWSSSFVLVSSGIALLLLAGLHRWRDGDPQPMRSGGLFGSFGRNAIAAYTLHELSAIILTGDALQWPFHLLAPMVGTQIASLTPVAIFILLVWLPVRYMDRRGWYLKI